MKKEELNTETAQQAPPIKKRLLSLDALRGITVAGMILVNNAGGKVSYAPLQHSAWNGLTLCDLVFSFLSVHHGYFNIYFIKQIQFQRFPTSGNQDIETHISYSMHRMGNRLV
jgi:hypothetical protein